MTVIVNHEAFKRHDNNVTHITLGDTTTLFHRSGDQFFNARRKYVNICPFLSYVMNFLYKELISWIQMLKYFVYLNLVIYKCPMK